MSERRQADTEVDRAGAAADRVLQIVHDLAVELNPGRERNLRVGLNSSLDRDLGLDSLGRAELLLRLERAFRVEMPQRLLGEAETPNDLLAVLEALEPAEGWGVAPERRRPALEVVDAAPTEAETLMEVLDWQYDRHPDRPHILLAEDEGGERTITYRDLTEAARAVAARLRHWGLAPGDRVALMLPTCGDFFDAFFGILYAGGVPVPIYPPMRLSQLEEHMRRQAVILENAGAVLLITVPEARRVATVLRARVDSLRAVETVDGLPSTSAAWTPVPRQPDDLALLQYTSGSTGDPKGVMLTHANLLSNSRAMIEAMHADSSDVFVSWMPLYHDMGLIGAWLSTMYCSVPVNIMSPLAFLARPSRWLWAMHRHRGTLSGGPNFGFELCLRNVDDSEIEGLDLSSVRMIVNGAEPVNADTLARFIERYQKYGLRPDAVAPVYGLAESTVGLAFPPPGRRPIVEHIRAGPLAANGVAELALAGEPDTHTFVACGRPLPRHEVRIVDETGREVGERRQGRLEFRGPSMTQGYFGKPEETAKIYHDGWIDSGDFAYMAGGDIFITGRSKDIIIRAGRNIYPHEAEATVGEVPGIRRGCVAVFGSIDAAAGTERIVVLAETRETDPAALESLRGRVSEAASDVLGGPPDEVVLAPPQSVPKTSSGKLRRSSARRLYEEGRIGSKARAVWWQIARMTAAGLGAVVRRQANRALSLVYAGYWWTVIGLLGAVCWLLVVGVSPPSLRWAVVRGVGRVFLALTGVRFTVEGEGRASTGDAIVVANHSSYIDSLVLAMAVPADLSFVAKKELESQRVAGPFLRRLGTLFVERFDPEAGLADAAAAAGAAQDGHPLVFYPEGTFTRAPGLLSFRLGAFKTAVDAGRPVLPVTLRGTRSLLRGGQWFPRRGPLSAVIGAAIAPEGNDFAAAIRLRDAARAQILAQCGEPDLAHERPAIFDAGG